MQRASILSRGGSTAACWLAAALAAAAASHTRTVTIHFNRDVRPILSDNCFHCHGPDEKDRKADLRLDTRAGATDPRDGSPAIVPGHPEKSLLWKRITATDKKKAAPRSATELVFGHSHENPVAQRVLPIALLEFDVEKSD